MFSLMVMGNGLGFWKIIPILVLRSLMSTSGAYRLSPWNSISPSILHPGTRSFILLMLLSRVDLPHPDGPMRAVMEFFLTGRSTLNRACFSPYQRSMFLMSMQTSSLSYLTTMGSVFCDHSRKLMSLAVFSSISAAIFGPSAEGAATSLFSFFPNLKFIVHHLTFLL